MSRSLCRLAVLCLCVAACQKPAALPAAAGTAATADSASQARTLLVSGSSSGAALTLAPGYFVNGAAHVPDGTGPFSLEGLDAAGASLFKYAFTPNEASEGANGAQFTFAIPLSVAARDALARVRVSAPGKTPAVRTSPSGRKGLLDLLAKASRDAEAAGGFSVERVAAGSVRLRYDTHEWAGVLVQDPDTHDVLAFATTGNAIILTTKPSLLLTFSDGVQSAPQPVTIPQ